MPVVLDDAAAGVSLEEAPALRVIRTSHNLVTTQSQLAQVVEAYSKVDAFTFDVETLGQHRGDPRRNDVAWIAMATTGRTDVIPMAHPHGELIRVEYPLKPSGETRKAKDLPLRPIDYSTDERKAEKIWTPAPAQLERTVVFDALEPIFFSEQITKVNHNIKFDIESIAKYCGGVIAPPFACTLVAQMLINSRVSKQLGLDDCLKRELGYLMAKGVGKEIEAHPFSVVARYAGLDARYTWLLWKALFPQLGQDGLSRLFALEMDVLEVLCRMEQHGALIDPVALEKLRSFLETELEDTEGKVYKTAGKYFAIGSPKELRTILFGSKADGGQALRVKRWTKGGASGQNKQPSTEAETLKLYKGNKVVDALLDHKDVKTLWSTYIIPLTGGTVTHTTNGKSKDTYRPSILFKGRVHTDFVQYGAETGRFSSRKPNLQNVPVRGERGKKVRDLYIAGEGNKLIVADYSQIEPRIIASESNDPTMRKAYLNDEDLYQAIADALGCTRPQAKVLVLAMAYGIGDEGLAGQAEISVSAAKKLRESQERKFPMVQKYKKAVIADVRRRRPPYVETMLGRRRYLPMIFAQVDGLRRSAERQAFNTRIQGSAADIIKLAMVRADRMIPDGAHLILTVHDELVTVAPDRLAEETADAIRVAMEGIKILNVPLVAEVNICDRWSEGK